MSFPIASQATGLSFTQLRKLREFYEYKYAQDAAYSLKHSGSDLFDLSTEVACEHDYFPVTLNEVEFESRCEGQVKQASKKVRWADKVEKAAVKRQRRDTGVWTDEVRRALIAGLVRECW